MWENTINSTHTFEKVSSKAGLVNRPVWDKLHPQCVWGGAHILGFVVTTESTNQRAGLQGAVSDLQVVVGAAVVPLNLQKQSRRSTVRYKKKSCCRIQQSSCHIKYLTFGDMCRTRLPLFDHLAVSVSLMDAIGPMLEVPQMSSMKSVIKSIWLAQTTTKLPGWNKSLYSKASYIPISLNILSDMNCFFSFIISVSPVRLNRT